MEARCPKCGFERLPQASECPVCGVVFAKLERAAAPPAAGAAGAVAPAAANPWPRSAPRPDRRADAADGVDPYAAPRSSRIVGGPAFPGFGEPQGGCWRSERLLVMERDARLPDRCVRCNAPAGERITKTLYWHSPWLYVLLVAWLLYLIVALAARKRVRIAAPLCASHLQRRRRTIAASWLAVLAGIAALFTAAAAGRPDLEWLYPVGILAALGGVIAAVFAHRILVAKRIDDRHVWLRRAAPAFLDSLPAGPSLL